MGAAPVTGVFELDPRPAPLGEDDLHAQGKFIRPSLWAKVAAAALDEDAVELWEQTLKEASDSGWMEGPFTWDQLNSEYGESWIPVRRFGLRQKDKLRSIDDLSECGVNPAWTVMEKISLSALDEATWLCMAVMRASRNDGEIAFAKSDGNVLRGKLHLFSFLLLGM